MNETIRKNVVNRFYFLSNCLAFNEIAMIRTKLLYNIK